MSRAGSQVMKMGSSVWDEEEEEVGGEDEESAVAGGLRRSRTWESLSSSSGQMSGQWVKPK